MIGGALEDGRPAAIDSLSAFFERERGFAVRFDWLWAVHCHEGCYS